MSDLDRAVIAAHQAGDLAALVTLYTQAADAVEEADIDAACFLLTHAHVFALEAGDPRAEDLRARLVRYGREVPL